MSPLEFELKNILENQIKEMAASGLFGTIKEFYFWHSFLYNEFKIDYKDFSKIFHEMISNQILANQTNLKNEYIYNKKFNFSSFVEFISPVDFKYSPIQFVRSKLISFLNYFQVQEEVVYDIIIGVVEAVENAVKYSADDKIYIKYFIENNVFYVEIRNKYKQPEINKDIDQGKYNSTVTLMRGVLVMSKLFDEMDIDLIQNQYLAIFYAKKILTFKNTQSQ
ncbi:MAG: ATP-binding protein [Leptonema sp. (in: bacteria)]